MDASDVTIGEKYIFPDIVFRMIKYYFKKEKYFLELSYKIMLLVTPSWKGREKKIV